MSQKFVVLYDVEDRRAWLVDGVCTLLHLVRTSLHLDLSGILASIKCFQLNQLEEVDLESGGKDAAIQVLLNAKNLNLKLHENPDEIHDEVTVIDGTSKHATKVKKSNFYFKDRVQQIYRYLELIINYQNEIDSGDGIRFETKKPTRSHLSGFDFRDVAECNDPFHRLSTFLRSRGRGWVDFTRALHAPTLFGSGFGEIFKPIDACSLWATLPKECDYLAVLSSDLNAILARHGSTRTSPWKVIDGIFWHCGDNKLFGTCRCDTSFQSRCDRVQVLLPGNVLIKKWLVVKTPSPKHLVPTGAVIFGHSRKMPLGWPDQGSPEEGEPEESDTEYSPPLRDSGLGSSLGSSVARPSQNTPDNTSTTASVSVQPEVTKDNSLLSPKVDTSIDNWKPASAEDAVSKSKEPFSNISVPKNESSPNDFTSVHGIHLPELNTSQTQSNVNDSPEKSLPVPPGAAAQTSSRRQRIRNALKRLRKTPK